MSAGSRRFREARAVGDLVAGALKDLGMPSAKLTARIQDAWAHACQESWHSQVRPLAFVGGVLEIGVRSAALRQELQQFHRARLLEVMRTALPDVALVGLRFTAEGEPDDGAREARGESR